MIKKYSFYAKVDKTREPIRTTLTATRLIAAKMFAATKRLPLKEFLKVYSVTKSR